MPTHSPFCDVDTALEHIRAGRMVVVIDDEDRENEGDLTMAAEKITPEAINFMAKYGRGLVCLAMTEERLDHLRLEQRPQVRLKCRSRYLLEQLNVSRRKFCNQIVRRLRQHGVFVRIAALAKPQPEELLVDHVGFLPRSKPLRIAVGQPVAARIRRMDLIDQQNLAVARHAKLILRIHQNQPALGGNFLAECK